ncbi:MAG: hypothetical protein HY537_16645 [Deltaproteobacteria bacterium]|nr:hypothetical protein [Deltaproteobacteria bacterium]
MRIVFLFFVLVSAVVSADIVSKQTWDITDHLTRTKFPRPRLTFDIGTSGLQWADITLTVRLSENGVRSIERITVEGDDGAQCMEPELQDTAYATTTIRLKVQIPPEKYSQNFYYCKYYITYNYKLQRRLAIVRLTNITP